MLVEAAYRRVAKKNAAASIRLQTVLVRVNDDRVRFVNPGIRPGGIACQVRDQLEIPTVSSIDVDAEFIKPTQLQYAIQRIDRASRSGSQCNDDRSNLAGLQRSFKGGYVHASPRIGRNVLQRPG